MISQRNNEGSGKQAGERRATMDRPPPEELRSREGDPRKRGQQDLRTAGSGKLNGRPKDDPSRAPESGTP